VETKTKTSGQTQGKSINAEPFTDHELRLIRDIGADVSGTNNDLKEGGGFKDIHWAGNLGFDKSFFRFLHAKLALSNFGLLRNQSTFPPVKV
jgi:hypothetical protein